MARDRMLPRALQRVKFLPCYWQAFLLCGLAAAMIFLPFQLLDGGFFHYAGDFNSQQITFYRYMNGFVKAGGTFSWETDLGSGAANAYSFYLYGSPFFWLSLLLPKSWLPYCMCPLLVLKFAVAGGGGCLYARRYLNSDRFAVYAGVLYGLSGFAVYNVFFNHFVDVVALFPYLLWALDEAMYRRRRGWFCVLVALNLLNNYFFFVGQVVFLAIYFVCRLAHGDYHLTAEKFGRLAVESLLGVGMGCILAVPAFLSLLDNPRSIDPFSGWGFLTYGRSQQYVAILLSWFMPPDCPYMSGIFSEGVIKWTSMTAYLPAVSCVGVVAYWRAHGRDSFKTILAVCMVCALVPGLNSAFYAMNSSYYARWFYMPVLLMAVCTARACEDPQTDLDTPAIQVGLLMIATIVFALVPVRSEDGEGWELGVLENPGVYLAALILGLAGLVVFYWVNGEWQGERVYGSRLVAATLAFACLFAVVHIGIGKFGQWETDADMVEQYTAAVRLAEKLPEGSYRIDTYNCHDNLALWMGKSGLQYFGSTAAPSILHFYPTVGVKRDVSSKPELDQYALRGLLGVRFLIAPQSEMDAFAAESDDGWTLYTEAEGFAVYENVNCLPLGLVMDYYVPEDVAEATARANRAALYLRALWLTEEQIERYGDYVQPMPEWDRYGYSYTRYERDIAAAREKVCTDFTMTNTGFTARARLEEPRLVLFAVPYDAGFFARVNGEAAEVLRVDDGLMAIPCPAGECRIECNYQAVGIAPARAVAAVCAVLFVGYLVLWERVRGKTRK